MPANAASAEVTVRSEVGWQAAPLTLQSGQAFSVEHRSGKWTVGYPGLARVGIDGYDAAADQEIYQGCKILTDQTYGHLLARVGGGAPFVVAHSGTFTAPSDGRLELRINDDDRCLGDNAGSVNLRVATAGPATGPPTGPPTGPTNGLKLYSADWSSGLNGWAGDSSWKALRGTLLSDGADSASTVFAPYDTRTISDYAVEARIRVIKQDRFAVVLRHSADDEGYIGVVTDHSAWLGVGPDPYFAEPIGTGQAFNPGSDWHTYRVEADGNVLRFLIDGAQYGTATDNRVLSGGMSGLCSRASQLEVSSFAVLRLR
jgi:hypothetical protein